MGASLADGLAAVAAVLAAPARAEIVDADAVVSGHLDKPLRHVAGADDGGDAPDPVALGTIEVQRIKVAVRVGTTRADDGDCGQPVPKATVRSYRGAWRWDAGKARWLGGSPALDRLDKLNQADF
jgi:hypothetical protein